MVENRKLRGAPPPAKLAYEKGFHISRSFNNSRNYRDCCSFNTAVCH